MGTVTILPETTKDPISLIGRRAGICYGANIEDAEANYKRGLDCIKNDHGRTIEFPSVHALFDGFSAKVVREWYTHIGGAPTRLQASTRYIKYKNFDYITPPSIQRIPEAKILYDGLMDSISHSIETLRVLGIPNEDATMCLPLSMATRFVDKRNPRNIGDMTRKRMCKRAYWEYRMMLSQYIKKLAEYSDEWKTFIELNFMPQCDVYGYCPENKEGCKHPPKKDVMIVKRAVFAKAYKR